jgi:hypothetical protein
MHKKRPCHFASGTALVFDERRKREVSRHMLGFTAFDVEAAETMTSVQIAMNVGLPYMALRGAHRDSTDLGRGAGTSVLVPSFYAERAGG